MKNLPYWKELPNLDLYLDQVLLYINQLTETEKELTSSMVNNYVKHGHINKPYKKKYNRIQIAQLIAITLLKQVFSIQDIGRTLFLLKQKHETDTLYNSFISCMLDTPNEHTPEIITFACQTLKLYQKTRTLILTLEGEKTHDNIKTE
ncbi:MULTISPECIES: DUF1836 domain-containing protein [unclassified Granulicatella]|uniref:DUF1836 domain-containing protein n=1 Tax=unclassified Granulicatella TaxID=2630493 RepID=UPI0010746038|nr:MULTISPECIES: DUF1836 domain-containing protein [unclassified Granulicatella]MBF0779749.1 DUF1836 domain-containing protein [Granulicatella sp. 19428wC4_WM01]TFU96267.1 DUF1836 domain-containing protein [Granulicatella sp. WM01]